MKLAHAVEVPQPLVAFPPLFGGGLIEARSKSVFRRRPRAFPPLFGAASLKQLLDERV